MRENSMREGGGDSGLAPSIIHLMFYTLEGKQC